MSYPRRVNLFVPWSKAMVAGATVDKPSYPGTSEGKRKSKFKPRKRRRRKKKKVMNG